MSAVAASYDRAGSADGATIGAMIAAMAHRGPDGMSFHADGPLALGHGLLGTARAALHVAADGSACAFDGRLDDRATLSGRLGIAAPADDAALVLAAYRRWGSTCPTRLTGDFAFALWDAPAQRLVCTRDRFGVRPLVYAEDGRRVLIASEGKALIAAGVATDPDEDYLADILAGLPANIASTPYRHIHRIAPGHSMIVDSRGVRTERYWSLPLPEPLPPGSAPEAFGAALAEAVRCRLEGPVPQGTLLSGGLDSSSLTCLAAHTLAPGTTLRTLSLVYDATPEHNERRFIEAVLARVPANATFIPADRLPPFDAFDSLLETQEGPIPAPNIANIRLLHQHAAKAGIRILLDGHGGDEVVSAGLGRLTELAAAGRWWRLWRELDAVHRAEGLSSRATIGAMLGAAGPVRRLRGRIGRWRRPAPPARAFAYVDPDFARRTHLAERHAEPHRPLPGADRSREAVQHHELLTGPLIGTAFELHDRSAAACGIEVRFPFWDERVVACALAADASDKLGGGYTRRLLRNAMAGILPPEIQWRRDKLDFTPHLLRQMVGGEDDGTVHRILFGSDSPIADIADLPALRSAHARLTQAHATDAACDGDALQAVWRAVTIGLWRERSARQTPAWQEAAE